MVEKTEEDTSGLGDIGQFFTAMRSRYGWVPALKRLGRLIGQWFLGGVVFVVLCVGGETIGVGFRKAAAMYWRWWVWPPFVVALMPIAFTLVLAAIQIACYAVVIPFVLVGELIGYERSGLSKRVSGGLVYLGFAFFVAWAAHDSAQRDASPKPLTKPVAVTAATSPPSQQQPTAAPPASSAWFNWRIILVAVVGWFAGVAKDTFGGVTSTWAKRFFFDERPEKGLFGPDGKPL